MTTQGQIGFVYNSRVSNALPFITEIIKTLGVQSRSWACSTVELELIDLDFANTSLLVVAGGDGTILRTVRIIAPHNIPIVGINMGRVGFMAELTVEEAPDRLPEYIEGGQRLEKRMMLEANVISSDGSHSHPTLHALNDIVVSRGSIARLIDVDTTVDGVPLTQYRADAVIVSTATGSTGYNLSAGGPIVYPETPIMLIHPVAAHTGLRHGLVLSENSVIEMKPSEDHEAVLSVDGFPDTALHASASVIIKKSPYVATFLRAHPPNTFYYALTRRLGLEAHPAYEGFDRGSRNAT